MTVTIKLLRSLALLLPAAILIFWLAAGANTGWTKTHVPVKTVEEITGIEDIRYQKRFVPGIEVLGAGALISAALGTTAVILRRARRVP